MGEIKAKEIDYDHLFMLSKITVKGIFQDCWEWNCKENNYGKVTLNKHQYILAHRASARIFHGNVKDKVVMHKCDNPRCFNPDHLEIGTQSDNMRDMVKKGRHPGLNVSSCINGHEYNSNNTYFTSRGHKQCKICKKEAKLRWKLKQKKLS